MSTYNIYFYYSRDGQKWVSSTMRVKASSQYEAISQVERKYPYVKDIKIMSVS